MLGSLFIWCAKTSLSPGITPTHLPTDLHNSTITSWGQGGLHFKWGDHLCLCSKSTQDRRKVEIFWSRGQYPSIRLYIAALKSRRKPCSFQYVQHVSETISKAEENWAPTLESQNKEELMYKNDASRGAKRASLWDRMDHTPGPRKASCGCKV